MLAKKILSFGAHPDDIEIGCAGTELVLAEKGYEIYHVCLTSGETGDRKIPAQQLAAIRENEAIEAGRVLGAKSVEFLRYPDGLTAFTPEMRIEVINLIRRIKPEIVFTHSSSDGISDHSIAHRLTLSAIQAAAGPWFQSSQNDPHRVSQIYGYEVWHPINQTQLSVDITKTISRKLDALSCHRTQLEGVDYLEACRGLARYRGTMAMTGTYAEAFEVIRAKL